jgi:hypothetical protein
MGGRAGCYRDRVYADRPPVDPSVLRPRRRWYAIAAIIGVVLAGLGTAGLVIGILTAVRAIDTGAAFASGSSATVTYSAGDNGGIYESTPGGSAQDFSCQVGGPSGAVPLAQPGGTFSTTQNGRTWVEIAVWSVPQAGAYRVHCTSDIPHEFSAGRAASARALLSGILGGMISFFALGGGGITVALVIVIVVAVRRRRHRERLQEYRRPGMP